MNSKQRSTESRSALPWRRARLVVGTLLALALGLAGAGQARTLVVDAQGQTDGPMVFRTIHDAVVRVRPGDRILVKQGVYRESVKLPKGLPQRPITLEAWPGHRPLISGADVLEVDWQPEQVALRTRPTDARATGPDGPANIVDEWLRYLEQQNAGESGPSDSARPRDAAPAQATAPARQLGIYAARVPQRTQVLIVNGEPLDQIGEFFHMGPKDWPNIVKVEGEDQRDLRPGSFYYDRKRQKLYVWLADNSHPADHVIERGARNYGIMATDDNHMRGFDVFYTVRLPDQEGQAGIHMIGDRIVVENCRSMYHDFSGISHVGHDGVIRDCVMAFNGNNGYTSGYCRNALMEGCTTYGNNTREYNLGWHGGGMKILHWVDSRLIRHHAYDEQMAVWFDINNLNILIADCLIENSGTGLYFEISRWARILNNTFRNCGRGVWIYSADVLVANNVVDACGEGITVTTSFRPAAYNMRGEPKSIPAALAVRNVMVLNNILIDCPGHFIAVGSDNPNASHQYVDHNVFVWTAPFVHAMGNHIKFMSDWDQYYGRLPIWQQQRGFDRNSKIVDEHYWIKSRTPGREKSSYRLPETLVLRNGGFVDLAGDSYQLRDDSPLRTLGVTVPQQLRSVYGPDVRPYEQTLLENAPEGADTSNVYEMYGQKHYRYQPVPEPLFMFNPATAPPGLVGINPEWSRTGNYPELVPAGSSQAAGDAREVSEAIRP